MYCNNAFYERTVANMESALKRRSLMDRGDVETHNDQQSIIEEIREVCRQMACIDTWFQMENDDDLIEACIYEREVLKAKYRYLIKRARVKNISSMPFDDIMRS